MKNFKNLKENVSNFLWEEIDDMYCLFGKTKWENNVALLTIFNLHNMPIYLVIYYDENYNILKYKMYNSNYDGYNYDNSEHYFVTSRLEDTKENHYFINFSSPNWVKNWNWDSNFYNSHCKKYSIPTDKITNKLILLFSNLIIGEKNIEKENIEKENKFINVDKLIKEKIEKIKKIEKEFKENKNNFLQIKDKFISNLKKINYQWREVEIKFYDILEFVSENIEILDSDDFSIHERDYRASDRIWFYPENIELHSNFNWEDFWVKKIKNERNYYYLFPRWEYFISLSKMMNKLYLASEIVLRNSKKFRTRNGFKKLKKLLKIK